MTRTIEEQTITDWSLSWTQKQKNPKQNSSELNPIIKRSILNPDQVRFISGLQNEQNIKKSIQITHQINRIKKKNHMVIIICTEKPFDKIYELKIPQ